MTEVRWCWRWRVEKVGGEGEEGEEEDEEAAVVAAAAAAWDQIASTLLVTTSGIPAALLLGTCLFRLPSHHDRDSAG